MIYWPNPQGECMHCKQPKARHPQWPNGLHCNTLDLEAVYPDGLITYFELDQSGSKCLHCGERLGTHLLMTSLCNVCVPASTGIGGFATLGAPHPQSYWAAANPTFQTLSANLVWGFTSDDPPPPPPKIPVKDRTCRKCQNKSLREVTLPDTLELVAFCRYCGEQEKI